MTVSDTENRPLWHMVPYYLFGNTRNDSGGIIEMSNKLKKTFYIYCFVFVIFQQIGIILLSIQRFTCLTNNHSFFLYVVHPYTVFFSLFSLIPIEIVFGIILMSYEIKAKRARQCIQYAFVLCITVIVRFIFYGVLVSWTGGVWQNTSDCTLSWQKIEVEASVSASFSWQEKNGMI